MLLWPRRLVARTLPSQGREAGSKPVGATSIGKFELVKVADNEYLPYLDGKLVDWTALFQETMERGQAGNAAPC